MLHTQKKKTSIDILNEFHTIPSGSITLAVVIVSHKCHINPDNVATPIAASLGDVVTLGLLTAISSYLYKVKGKQVTHNIALT